MNVAGKGDISCLLIDDLLSGENELSGHSLFGDNMDVRAVDFNWSGEAELLEALQSALFDARREGCVTAIAGRKTGAAGALALAEQLPVDRLILFAPVDATQTRAPGSASRTRARQVRRLCGYAWRNLSLCVSDVLIVETEDSRAGQALIEGGLRAHCRTNRLLIGPADEQNRPKTIAQVPQNVLSRFLQYGELPKSLAENHEMCIIYG